MLSSFFIAGVGIYAFYALQPYLLELSGEPEAYGIAGLVAAIVAGSQIVGGVVAPRVRRLFHRRTTALFAATAVSAVALGLTGVFDDFWVVLALIVVWGLLDAAAMPIRQAYLNGMIPSEQRASILSFDSLIGSTGGVAVQPVLGRAADLSSYGTSYAIGAGISALALPFIALSRREDHPCDAEVATEQEPVASEPGELAPPRPVPAVDTGSGC
jgi:MFS family permease